MELEDLRQRLDAIDEQVVALLSERARIIDQVVAVKHQHNIPIYIPAREASIIQRLRTINTGPLSSDAVERIYRTIIEEMRTFESERSIR